MDANQLLQFITQVTIILIALATVADYGRRRDAPRMDVMLLFLDFALIVATQWLAAAEPGRFPWLAPLGSGLLVAHPFLLLRLVKHLRTIPPAWDILAIAGLLISWVLIGLFPAGGSSMPAPFVLFIVIFFILVELYAANALIRGGFTSQGVTRRRLLLAGTGSVLIGMLILEAGVTGILPAAAPYLSPFSQITSLASVICYFLGFSPPAWLRRSWQLNELYHFLSSTSGSWLGRDQQETLEKLCQAAASSVGGAAAAVGLWNEGRKQLEPTTACGDMEAVQVLDWSNAEVLRSWQRSVAVEIHPPVKNSWVHTLLATPIATSQRIWGVLVVYLRQTPLFPSDDLTLLSLYSEQTALALDYVQLLSQQESMIGQLRRYTQRLVGLNDIDRAILAARSTQRIGQAALAHLRRLVPCERASIILFNFDQQNARFVAWDADAGFTPSEADLLSLDEFRQVGSLEKRDFYAPNYEDLRQPMDHLKRLIALGLHSSFLTPLVVEQKVIGQLALSSTQVNAFPNEHQEIAREVAGQLAIAIQQARLRDELQDYARSLEQRVAERTRQLEISAQELKAANQDLESFTYSVSHDLRAPLRAIDGFSHILQKQFSAELSEDARRYLDLVRKNAQEMSQLIEDLLKFSRLGRQPLEKEPVQVSEIAQSVVHDLLQARQDAGRFHIQIRDLPSANADPHLLKQVYVNLISNALKFSTRREQPTIEIGCQQLDGKDVFFVRDNGVGFDMEAARKLFAVFQRLHSDQDFEGTGVGLAIVHRIISRHGGRVWAEAEVDQGATFYFTLD